ncbi:MULTISPECIES: hypothetical protein [Kribbella]|jgi:hypothetical protein|uniref:Uncharacterized protein n=1 Tax=Kribbella pratensis TaxID=2512112 RepID=A0ABY2FBI0_9ACTN|nr:MULTISPECIES: hypothetical protein [Kribbella]TDW87853.1 hypothetical protein EV137_5937 [Kribbella pratensis]TDW88952.1 hypothetical protein EV647_5966 [Kribbella sp. VKM Ac-2566]
MDAYREAQRLYAEAMLSHASGRELIAELERALQRIGELLPQAAPDQRSAVLLMNSSIAERLAGLAEESR